MESLRSETHPLMSKSLLQHGPKEIFKQLTFRMKNTGLDTIAVQVTRQSGKIKIDFTGSAAQVVQAKQILTGWT